MRARWAGVSFGAGLALGALSLPGVLVLLRQHHARTATDVVGQAVSTGPTDPSSIGLGQGGTMNFGVYDPSEVGIEDYVSHAYDRGGALRRIWCPYCYGSGCARCHHIGEVAP